MRVFLLDEVWRGIRIYNAKFERKFHLKRQGSVGDVDGLRAGRFFRGFLHAR